jgi:hypothetical protein
MLLGVGVCAANRVAGMIRETKRTKVMPRMRSVIAFGVLIVNKKAEPWIVASLARPCRGRYRWRGAALVLATTPTRIRVSGILRNTAAQRYSRQLTRTAERFAILLIQSECVKQEHRAGAFSGAACLNPFVAVPDAVSRICYVV